jgi:hypothetical protein
MTLVSPGTRQGLKGGGDGCMVVQRSETTRPATHRSTIAPSVPFRANSISFHFSLIEAKWAIRSAVGPAAAVLTSPEFWRMCVRGASHSTWLRTRFQLH